LRCPQSSWSFCRFLVICIFAFDILDLSTICPDNQDADCKEFREIPSHQPNYELTSSFTSFHFLLTSSLPLSPSLSRPANRSSVVAMLGRCSRKSLQCLSAARKSHSLSPEHKLSLAIDSLHKNACCNQKNTYIDPVSGYVVMTAYGHQKRGKCCGNKCRHCPYDHINVKTRINPSYQGLRTNKAGKTFG
jgi:hypothetical protein